MPRATGDFVKLFQRRSELLSLLGRCYSFLLVSDGLLDFIGSCFRWAALTT